MQKDTVVDGFSNGNVPGPSWEKVYISCSLTSSLGHPFRFLEVSLSPKFPFYTVLLSFHLLISTNLISIQPRAGPGKLAGDSRQLRERANPNAETLRHCRASDCPHLAAVAHRTRNPQAAAPP